MPGNVCHHRGRGSSDAEQSRVPSAQVNCISFVDHEDLVILETEREGITINPASIGIPATWSARMHAVPPTKAKLGRGSLVCCNNCPSRGCKECPMYGIGQNPIYMERLAEREQKRADSGEAAKEALERSNQEALDEFLRGASEVPIEVAVLQTDAPSDTVADTVADTALEAAAAAAAEALRGRAEEGTVSPERTTGSAVEISAIDELVQADEAEETAEAEEAAGVAAEVDVRAQALDGPSEEVQTPAGDAEAEEADEAVTASEASSTNSSTAAPREEADEAAEQKAIEALDGVVVPVGESILTADEPSAEFFDALYGPPVGLSLDGDDDDDDLPPPLGLS